jgi:hypothetical protein
MPTSLYCYARYPTSHMTLGMLVTYVFLQTHLLPEVTLVNRALAAIKMRIRELLYESPRTLPGSTSEVKGRPNFAATPRPMTGPAIFWRSRFAPPGDLAGSKIKGIFGSPEWLFRVRSALERILNF